MELKADIQEILGRLNSNITPADNPILEFPADLPLQDFEAVAAFESWLENEHNYNQFVSYEFFEVSIYRKPSLS